MTTIAAHYYDQADRRKSLYGGKSSTIANDSAKITERAYFYKPSSSAVNMSNEDRSVKVYDPETGKTYKSIVEAATELGLTKSGVQYRISIGLLNPGSEKPKVYQEKTYCPIVHIPTGKVYNRVADITKELGIPRGTLYSHICGKVKNQQWRYV